MPYYLRRVRSYKLLYINYVQKYIMALLNQESTQSNHKQKEIIDTWAEIARFSNCSHDIFLSSSSHLRSELFNSSRETFCCSN